MSNGVISKFAHAGGVSTKGLSKKEKKAAGKLVGSIPDPAIHAKLHPHTIGLEPVVMTP
jgi:hypothetical protein